METTQARAPVTPPVGSASSNNIEIIKEIQTAMKKGYKYMKLIYNVDGNILVRAYPVEAIKVTWGYDMRTKTQKPSYREVADDACYFIPDDLTGVREAWLLDTPYNRRFLATHLLENRWTIEDEVLLREIQALPEASNIVIDTSIMSQDATQQAVVTPKVAVESMSDDAKRKLLAQKKKEIADLEAMVAPVEEKPAKPVATAAPARKISVTGSPANKIDDKVRSALPRDVVDRCTATVHMQLASVVEEAKMIHGEKFKDSALYRSKVQSVIDELILTEMYKAEDTPKA